MVMAGLVWETRLFLAASTATSISSVLRPHWGLIHALAIQVTLPIIRMQKRI